MKKWILEQIGDQLFHVEAVTREVFEGRMSRDLEVGDLFEEIDADTGIVKTMKKIHHEETPEGYTIVHSVEVTV
jgi:hypothetical protein